ERRLEECAERTRFADQIRIDLVAENDGSGRRISQLGQVHQVQAVVRPEAQTSHEQAGGWPGEQKYARGMKVQSDVNDCGAGEEFLQTTNDFGSRINQEDTVQHRVASAIAIALPRSRFCATNREELVPWGELPSRFA